METSTTGDNEVTQSDRLSQNTKLLGDLMCQLPAHTAGQFTPPVTILINKIYHVCQAGYVFTSACLSVLQCFDTAGWVI